MYTPKEIREKIKTLDEKIASGVTTTSVDGTTVTINLAELRKERTRLMTMSDQYRKRRPPTASIYLG